MIELANNDPKKITSKHQNEFVMNDFNHLPDSISHKQLYSLLTKAEQQPKSSEPREKLLDEDQEAFRELLIDWSSLSQKLLKKLNHKYDYIVEGREPKSLMALGALEAHLNMAIQAHKASGL